jgi:hypothetical protein
MILKDIVKLLCCTQAQTDRCATSSDVTDPVLVLLADARKHPECATALLDFANRLERCGLAAAAIALPST